MDSSMNDAREMIRDYVRDVEWDNPFWLDDVQDQFPKLSAGEIECLYAEELKFKLNSWSTDDLERIYQEQMDTAPDSRNYILVEVIENLLATRQTSEGTA
jgi:hypothetical protein